MSIHTLISNLQTLQSNINTGNVDINNHPDLLNLLGVIDDKISVINKNSQVTHKLLTTCLNDGERLYNDLICEWYSLGTLNCFGNMCNITSSEEKLYINISTKTNYQTINMIVEFVKNINIFILRELISTRTNEQLEDLTSRNKNLQLQFMDYDDVYDCCCKVIAENDIRWFYMRR